MQPRFLRTGEAVPARSLVVDCGLAGAATYSHWQGAPATPTELRADSSTAIVLNAARDPARWLSGFDLVVNDHVDADGLLAMAVACQPTTALDHAGLLIGAAEAGDFSAWPGEASFRLMLRLHRLLAAEQAGGGAWEQRACTRACTDLATLISESAATPYATMAAQVAARRRSLRDDVTVVPRRGVVGIAWQERLGHRSDNFYWCGEADDLPPWICAGVGGEADFQLLAMAAPAASRTTYWLLAPGHSWARVVDRPTVSWPRLDALAAALQAQERGPGRWLAGAGARRHGFVCQLACTEGERIAASSLPFAVVLELVAQALAAAG